MLVSMKHSRRALTSENANMTTANLAGASSATTVSTSVTAVSTPPNAQSARERNVYKRFKFPLALLFLQNRYGQRVWCVDKERGKYYSIPSIWG